MDFDKCGHKTSQKIIVAEENKRKFEIINKSARIVSKVKIDGCLIKSEQQTKV